MTAKLDTKQRIPRKRSTKVIQDPFCANAERAKKMSKVLEALLSRNDALNVRHYGINE